MTESRVFRFGVFEADVRRQELRRRGLRIHLQEKAFKILTLLLSRPGELVSREEIRSVLWPRELHLDFEHGLNVLVGKLRTVLGDSAASPRFVETVRGRGYRFIAPVEGPPTAGSRLLVAVLPFENLSGDPAREFVSDGLTEEILTALGSLHPRRLGVIARSSVMRFKGVGASVSEIARDLGVGHVVEGSVRLAGTRTRISVQLIEAHDQGCLWTRSYERQLGDVLGLQREVAEEVARALAPELLPELPAREPASRTAPGIDGEAYTLYLKARHAYSRRTPDGLRETIALLDEAIRRDPGYARAHAALAEAYATSVEYGTAPGDGFSQAAAAADRALALDSTLVQPHAVRAVVRHRFDWDWDGAEREYRHALSLNPSLATAHQGLAELHSQMGRHDAAREEIRLASQLDPLSLILRAIEAWLSFHARRYDEALEICGEVLAQEPSFVVADFVRGRTLVQLRRHDEAVAACRRASAGPEPGAFALAALAVAQAAAGQEEEARRELERLENPASGAFVSPYLLAKVHAALGESERALDLLEEAWRTRTSWMADLKVDPELGVLRSHPRFVRLYRELAFPE